MANTRKTSLAARNPPATRGRSKAEIPPARAAARIMQLEHDLADAATRLSALATENVSLAARRDELEANLTRQGREIECLGRTRREETAHRVCLERHIERLNAAIAEASLQHLDHVEMQRICDRATVADNLRMNDAVEASRAIADGARR